jgi:DNA replication protein DnaC
MLMAELKELRLHGMAGAWAELTGTGVSRTQSSKWLIEHLLQAEHTDRAMRSVSHQMNMAKLPDAPRSGRASTFKASQRRRRLISELATWSLLTPRRTWC